MESPKQTTESWKDRRRSSARQSPPRMPRRPAKARLVCKRDEHMADRYPYLPACVRPNGDFLSCWAFSSLLVLTCSLRVLTPSRERMTVT